MYETFYGLNAKPFQMVPDPEFLFWSESHLMAFTMLRYGIENAAPITVITGEVGSGKTTLLRQLLEEFPANLVAGLVSNMQAGKGELLEWALMAFNQPFDGGHVARFQRFQQFVLDCYAEGKQVALIVDEAQNLGMDQLEELRMLSNINAEQDQLLQLILVGQPELRSMLNQPQLRQFSQRVTCDYHIAILTEQEVEGYIQRRLAVAGFDMSYQLFPRRTCELIHQATGGVPRLINVLCDLCLVYGYASEKEVIDEDILRDLAADIDKNGIYNQLKPIGGAPTLVEGLENTRSSPVTPLSRPSDVKR